jgi:hypothetical protein
MPTKKTTRTSKTASKQQTPTESRKLAPMPPLAPMIVRTMPNPRPAPTCDQIARRAFELFAETGYQHGHDVEHWLQAENELWARV